MKKNKIIWLILLAGLTLLLLFFIRKVPESIEPVQSLNVHHAQDHSISLNKIKIKAFYFVPVDRTKTIDPVWDEQLASALNQLRQFYAYQLHQSVDIAYDLYPEPVIGLSNASFYDGENTSQGNPNALVKIQAELHERVFTKSGDLYDQAIAAPNASEYQIMAIMYQGVGSSALMLNQTQAHSDELVVLNNDGLPAMLISQFYFFDPNYQEYGVTIMAHEFGHTLGLLDAYDLKTGQPTSDDLMGLGRFKPLEYTYLSLESKRQLGLDF